MDILIVITERGITRGDPYSKLRRMQAAVFDAAGELSTKLSAKGCRWLSLDEVMLDGKHDQAGNVG